MLYFRNVTLRYSGLAPFLPSDSGFRQFDSSKAKTSRLTTPGPFLRGSAADFLP